MNRLPPNNGMRAGWLDELRDMMRPMHDMPARRPETIGAWFERTQLALLSRRSAQSGQKGKEADRGV